jgi:prepilin-type N-terminal cleavage/methylation domain-containing protein
MNPVRTSRPRPHRLAFTLIELLVVLAIMGALAALAVPAFKGLGASNAFTAAQRQVVDDLKFARQLAIKNRSTVYMVFAPTNAWDQQQTFLRLPAQYGTFRTEALTVLSNVIYGQFSSYAIYTQRRLGEQPGVERPRYLTEWRSLPQGVVFSKEMMGLSDGPSGPAVTNRAYTLPQARFPFPLVIPGAELRTHYLGTAPIWNGVDRMPVLPFIAFDPSGRIADITYAGLRDALGRDVLPGDDVILAVGPGSVFLPRQPDGQPRPGAVDLVETPRFGYTNGLIRISYYTGRARLLKNLPK